MQTPIPSRAMTHAGRFHADDLFSAALLRLLNPEIEISRGFSPPPDFDGIVFDIGRGAFDHHQPDSLVRDNGVKYAAFGLLWRAFGTKLLDKADAERFDLHFVQPLDLDDNTGCGHPLAEALSAWNPVWDAPADHDRLFGEACEVAYRILAHKLQSIRATARARSLVQNALANMQEQVVVLPQYAPWKSVLSESDALFVIYPSQRGGFAAQAVSTVSTADSPSHLKQPFPAAWGGLSGDALADLSGIAGLSFCHANCFLLSGDDVPCLLEACRAARAVSPAPPSIP